MGHRVSRIRRYVAAVVTAATVGIVGVGAISTETAQAAGVVVEHRTVGTATPTTPPRRND
jgi:phosphoglycerate dehydrogenase-like enzyme